MPAGLSGSRRRMPNGGGAKWRVVLVVLTFDVEIGFGRSYCLQREFSCVFSVMFRAQRRWRPRHSKI